MTGSGPRGIRRRIGRALAGNPPPLSPDADQGCPKHMVMGPCGGVRPDGGCEVRAHPCAFPAPVTWSDPVSAVPLDAVPLILTDFSSEPYSLAAHAAVAGILAPVSDAVLIGEHQDRPDFPPAQLASILQRAGARPWITLSCRDRNRVLEQELHGLRELGVGAVLCVTGDARAYDVRPDVTQVFDLDGPRQLRPVVRAVLDDPDPVSAAIAAAGRQALALLDIPGVAGVNISGSASARGPEFAAKIKAELAARIREGSAG